MRRRTYVDGPRGYVAGPGLGEGQGQRPSYPFLSFQAKGYRTIWTVDVFRGLYRRKSVNYIKVVANPARVVGEGGLWEDKKVEEDDRYWW